jgi:transcription elongation regulator 1
VKEQLSGFQRELDKEREQLKKDKAIENFKALLTDMVRTADAEWKDTKKNLRKDPRWEQDIDRDEKESLFEEHVNLLEKKRKMAFHALLSEHCTLTTTWKEVKKAIKSDPRFDKIFSTERKRDLEKEFESYIKDKYHTAKAEFKELLKETKLITYKSLQMIRESEEQNHLRDIEKILQKDKRYLLLDVIPEERSNILMDYIIDLKQRGVPPPPTASLDRRKL